MIIFGPRKITLSEIVKDYDRFLQSFHFITEDTAASGVKLSKNPEFKELQSEKYAVALALGLDDRRLLNRFFRDNEFSHLVSSKSIDVYAECDGFGRITKDDLQSSAHQLSLRHVIESSDEATARAASLIRQILTDVYNQ